MYAYSLNILYLINLQPSACTFQPPELYSGYCMLPCASSTSQSEGLQRTSRGPAQALHNSNAVPPQGLWRACAAPAEGLQNSRAIYDPVVLQGLKA